MAKFSAKQFQVPLLNVIHSIQKGDLSKPVSHQDTYHLVCHRMGISDVKFLGTAPDGRQKITILIQDAFKNLKRSGLVASAGRGKWTLTEEGREEVGATQEINPKILASPVSSGYVGEKFRDPLLIPAYRDPVILKGLIASTRCFGYFTTKSHTCATCPLKAECLNKMAEVYFALAVALAEEDAIKNGTHTEPKKDPYDWSQWDLKRGRTITAKVSGAFCPKCKGNIRKGSDVLWLRSKVEVNGKRQGALFHLGCKDD